MRKCNCQVRREAHLKARNEAASSGQRRIEDIGRQFALPHSFSDHWYGKAQYQHSPATDFQDQIRSQWRLVRRLRGSQWILGIAHAVVAGSSTRPDVGAKNWEARAEQFGAKTVSAHVEIPIT